MKPSILAGLLCLVLYSGRSYAQTTKSDPQMKEFILLVRVPVTYGGEQAKVVNPQWNKVLDKWKADNVFVTSFVFPTESYVLSGADRTVKKEMVISDGLKVVSSIILHARSLENAVELAKACPVLAYGGTVECREVWPRTVQPAN